MLNSCIVSESGMWCMASRSYLWISSLMRNFGSGSPLCFSGWLRMSLQLMVAGIKLTLSPGKGSPQKLRAGFRLALSLRCFVLGLCWIINFGSESHSILGPTLISLTCGPAPTLAPGSNFTVRVQGLVMIELFGEHRY